VPPTDTTRSALDTADDRGVECIADLHLVGGHHDHTVDDESRLVEQFRHQRTAVVLFAMRRPVVHDDHQRPTHQLHRLFHVCHRISGARQWPNSRWELDGHCLALPSVT
jgi:hypothetical protein